MTARISKADIWRYARDLYEESEFELWFGSPQALLGGLSPAQMVDAGRGGEVVNILRCIEEGAYL